MTLGALIDLTADREQYVREEAMVALTRILPFVTAGDYDSLNAPQRHALYKQLRGPDVVLMKAVLETFHRVGDCQAMAFVERFLARFQREGFAPHLQDTAARCLAYLQQVSNNVTQDTHLLRPVDQPLTASQGLLRPIAAASTDTAVLLRAGPNPAESSGA